MNATGFTNTTIIKIALFVTILLSTVPTTGCVGDPEVYGNISPTTFQFVTVIEHDMRGPGGWQVAQVAVLLGRLSTMFPRAAVCDVEVQVPIVNRQQGYISVPRAQTESAIAADKAARELLGKRRRPTAALCRTFRDRMMYYLADRTIGTIAGSRVTSFQQWPGKKVPRKTFPAKRGR